MVDLNELGWDEEWQRLLAGLADPQLRPGRVALEDKHAFVVVTAAGEAKARVAGRLLHARTGSASLPKVGDWVALTHKTGDARAVIQHVLPRRTSLTRKVPGRETEPQVLAANIDIAFIVQALDQTFNPRRLERFLVMAHEGGARAVVILNKADLGEETEERLAAALESAGSATVLVTSARTRRGLGELRRLLASGRTCVFVGTSGVGKSSLINRLLGEATQPTLEVRDQDSKGRHATSWRELILVPGGGLVIDTPGMREFHLWAADAGMLDAFPDIAELSLRCHFRACSHTVEKRCAVREALDQGTLEKHRFESYRKLQTELDELAEERREHAYLLRRRHAGTIRRLLAEPDERT